jgi:uncharacterized protein (DUF488 family)
MTVYSIGHGTLSEERMVSLLDAVPIDRLIDVRSSPGSRRNPQFGREAMQQWLLEAGLDYVWVRELGGRRRPARASRHVALRNDGFRGYADYMETSEFGHAFDRLCSLADDQRVVVMCSESLWWRCHRRLIADYLVLLRNVDVVHLMHDGRRDAHVPTEAARVAGGMLVYDVGATPPLAID